MKRNINLQYCAIMLAASFLGSCNTTPVNKTNNSTQLTQQTTVAFDIPSFPENGTVFYLVNDLGRNGYYQQKPIASLMGWMGEETSPDFIVAAGDTHHFDGVASTSDPLWMTNYELIYNHPELMIDWYGINGNHEYRGNTQAVLDYSDISRRWNVPDYYYTKIIDAGSNQQAQLIFIDTTPLIEKYRRDTTIYPDAAKQSKIDQLAWLENTLAQSNAKWKIVIGHHPVYAETSKDPSERSDLQAVLAPLFEQYNVDIYLCGHIHNFQHIKPENSTTEYLVNSSASKSRKVKAIEGTQFCSPDAGFTIVSVNDDMLGFALINGEGKMIYQFDKQK